jgi:hypothetical protein
VGKSIGVRCFDIQLGDGVTEGGVSRVNADLDAVGDIGVSYGISSSYRIHTSVYAGIYSIYRIRGPGPGLEHLNSVIHACLCRVIGLDAAGLVVGEPALALDET